MSQTSTSPDRPAGLAPIVAPAEPLDPVETARYARHLSLPELGQEGQRRLKAARVLVLGAGGLGSPVLLYLAAAGVGTIGIVDCDQVEASNLQRQVIHGESDLGSAKVDSAARRVAELNPWVDVRRHPGRLTRANAAALFADYDLVIDGTDNFETRYVANDAAFFARIPYVWASILRFDGQVSVFAPHLLHDTPCYRCLTPRQPPAEVAPSCAEGGVLGVLCGVVGSIQATEAIKLIAGLGQPLVGRVLVYDALAMQQRALPIRRDPDCALCGDAPTITTLDSVQDVGHAEEHTIDAAALADRLRQPGRVRVLDVREPAEFAAGSIPGAESLPMSGLLEGSVVSALPAPGDDGPLIVYCQSGVRSARALARLHELGFDAVHLQGGYAAWCAWEAAQG